MGAAATRGVRARIAHKCGHLVYLLRLATTEKLPTPVVKVTVNVSGAVRSQPGGGAEIVALVRGRA